MITLFLISLLFNCSITDLTDDVVAEYSVIWFSELVATKDTTDELGSDSESCVFVDNYCANEFSADINKLFYRCPRDCVIHAWRST